MGKLILARAGTTDYDEQQRIAGTLDLPVNVRGQAEMLDLARDLEHQNVAVIYAAAGETARFSAQILGDRLDIKVKELAELTNQDFGLWQGLQLDEVRRKHPRVYKQWEEAPCAVCPPNGEMAQAVLDRIGKILKPSLKKHQGDTVVVVAPDPLRKFIRCYVTRAEVCHPWAGNGQTPKWELLDVSLPTTARQPSDTAAGG